MAVAVVGEQDRLCLCCRLPSQCPPSPVPGPACTGHSLCSAALAHLTCHEARCEDQARLRRSWSRSRAVSCLPALLPGCLWAMLLARCPWAPPCSHPAHRLLAQPHWPSHASAEPSTVSTQHLTTHLSRDSSTHRPLPPCAPFHCKRRWVDLQYSLLHGMSHSERCQKKHLEEAGISHSLCPCDKVSREHRFTKALRCNSSTSLN